MSYNIIGKPDKFSAVYNPIYFYADSSNSLVQPGFRYLATVLSAGTSSELASFQVAPRPIDGYGVIDVNQVLVPYTSYYLNQTMETIIDAFEDYVDYDVRFGETWIENRDYTDNEYVTSGTYVGFTAFVGLNASPFVTGDFVTVTQDAGFSYAPFNGTFEILSANPNTIIVNILHPGSTPVNPGNITYADLRKVIFSAVTTQSNYSAFNGALGHQQMYDYTGTTYTMSSLNPTAKFLTNMPDNYTVRATNGMWLNLHSDIASATTYCIITTAYGTYDFENPLPVSAACPTIQQFALGPQLVENISQVPSPIGGNTWLLGGVGTYPVFKNFCWCWTGVRDEGGLAKVTNTDTVENPWYTNFLDQIVYADVLGTEVYIDNSPAINQVVLGVPYSAMSAFTTGCLSQRTDWYTLQMFEDPTFSATSELRTFNIDWSTTRFGNIELLFVDRLGSFIPANFDLQNVTTINTKRNEYQTLLGNLQPAEVRWGFASTARGRNVLNTTVTKQIDLISNWISEEVMSYYQELITSPLVYIKQNGLYWPVIVKTDSFQVLNKNNKKNLQIRISIEMAVNDRIQNY